MGRFRCYCLILLGVLACTNYSAAEEPLEGVSPEQADKGLFGALGPRGERDREVIEDTQAATDQEAYKGLAVCVGTWAQLGLKVVREKKGGEDPTGNVVILETRDQQVGQDLRDLLDLAA